jgi:hypothetical protein
MCYTSLALFSNILPSREISGDRFCRNRLIGCDSFLNGLHRGLFSWRQFFCRGSRFISYGTFAIWSGLFQGLLRLCSRFLSWSRGFFN